MFDYSQMNELFQHITKRFPSTSFINSVNPYMLKIQQTHGS